MALWPGHQGKTCPGMVGGEKMTLVGGPEVERNGLVDGKENGAGRLANATKVAGGERNGAGVAAECPYDVWGFLDAG